MIVIYGGEGSIIHVSLGVAGWVEGTQGGAPPPPLKQPAGPPGAHLRPRCSPRAEQRGRAGGPRRLRGTNSYRDRHPCVMTHVRTRRRRDAGRPWRAWVSVWLCSRGPFCAASLGFNWGCGAGGGVEAGGGCGILRGPGPGWEREQGWVGVGGVALASGVLGTLGVRGLGGVS